MRIALNVASVVMLLVGGVWFLQGINVLPGSFMTGQFQWAVWGGIVFALGVLTWLAARRLSRPPH